MNISLRGKGELKLYGIKVVHHLTLTQRDYPGGSAWALCQHEVLEVERDPEEQVRVTGCEKLNLSLLTWEVEDRGHEC